MANTTIAIDPGKHGAVAVFRGRKLNNVYDCPLIMEKGKKAEFDKAAIYRLLEREVNETMGTPNIVLAVIEAQHAHPQQGGVGNFSSGFGYGLWMMAMQSLGIGHLSVQPQRWRKLIFTQEELDWCNDQDTKPLRVARRKALSIQRAKETFPMWEHRLRRKMDDGRAEAILIGLSSFRMNLCQAARL